MIYVITAIFAGWIFGIIAIAISWQKDCKEIGKDNLAVPLGERLRAYFICFILPIILTIIFCSTGLS